MFVGFKARNHKQQVAKHGSREDVDDRRTLPEVFDPLNAEFKFTIDVAANDKNFKVPRYYTLDVDGLEKPWVGERVWCNPPYSNIRPWVEKALFETANGCHCVVMLLPNNRCEQRWWQELIELTRDSDRTTIQTRFLPGRPRFGWPADRARPVKGDRPPFGLVVVIFRPKL